MSISGGEKRNRCKTDSFKVLLKEENKRKLEEIMGCGMSSNSILEPKGKKIIMLGAMGSGKTSLLYQVTKRMSVQAIPTVGHNAEYFQVNKEKFVLYDIGARNLDLNQVEHLLESAIAVVFMVDASNPNAHVLRESCEMFQNALKNPHLQGLPIAICLNKQDLADNIFIDEEVLEKHFQLKTMPENIYKIFKISYKTRKNINEPFSWIQSLKLKPQIIKKQQSKVSSKKQLASSYGVPVSTERPQSNVSKAFPEIQEI